MIFLGDKKREKNKGTTGEGGGRKKRKEGGGRLEGEGEVKNGTLGIKEWAGRYRGVGGECERGKRRGREGGGGGGSA